MNKQSGLAPILIVLLIAAALGGYLLYQKQTKPVLPQSVTLPSSSSASIPTATGSAETANPDSTGANWKTYTNQEFMYSFKYPDNWYIDEKNTRNSTVRFFKVGDEASDTWTQRMAKGSEQLIVSVTNDQSFDEVKKSLNLTIPPTTIQGKEALRYTTGVYILLDSTQNKILSIYRPQYPDEGFLDQILSTFKFLDQTKSDETTNWKTYRGDKYTILYPPSWKLDPSLNGLDAVTGSEGFVIISSDYKHNAGGSIEEGMVITLFVDSKPFSGNLGQESEEKTTWLGEKATLGVYKYEGNSLVLTADIKGINYQLVMSAPTDKVRNTNKDLFLRIAESLRISQ